MEALNEGMYGTSNLIALSSFKKKLKEPDSNEAFRHRS